MVSSLQCLSALQPKMTRSYLARLRGHGSQLALELQRALSEYEGYLRVSSSKRFEKELSEPSLCDKVCSQLETADCLQTVE